MNQRILDPEWENIFRRADDERAPIVEVLSHVPIFSLLSRSELLLIARAVHVRHYAAGEVVVRRGVSQSGFYVIHSGSVHIVHGDGHVVGTLNALELIGEFALLNDSPRSSSLVAAEPSELIGFFKPDLMNILVTRPALGCKITLRLAEEMAQSLQVDYIRLRAMGYPFVAGQNIRAEMDPTAL